MPMVDLTNKEIFALAEICLKKSRNQLLRDRRDEGLITVPAEMVNLEQIERVYKERLGSWELLRLKLVTALPLGFKP